MSWKTYFLYHTYQNVDEIVIQRKHKHVKKANVFFSSFFLKFHKLTKLQYFQQNFIINTTHNHYQPDHFHLFVSSVQSSVIWVIDLDSPTSIHTPHSPTLKMSYNVNPSHHVFSNKYSSHKNSFKVQWMRKLVVKYQKEWPYSEKISPTVCQSVAISLFKLVYIQWIWAIAQSLANNMG